MKVRDVMTIKDAPELMRREQVHRMPVVNPDGVLQGILSINYVVLQSEEGSGDNTEIDQTYFTPVELMKGSSTHTAAPEGTLPAFDERGYSPIEKVFNEQEEG